MIDTTKSKKDNAYKSTFQVSKGIKISGGRVTLRYLHLFENIQNSMVLKACFYRFHRYFDVSFIKQSCL